MDKPKKLVNLLEGRIEELARDLPDATNEFQREGTRKRVESGKASEPTPQIWKPVER